MRKQDRGVAAFLLLLGLVAAIETGRLRIGEPSRPGPGFFPFYLAVCLCFVSLGLLLRSLGSGNREEATVSRSPEQARRSKVVWTFAALFSYAFAFEPLGFPLATFLLLLFLYRVVEPRRWRAAIGGSLVATLLTYTLFQLLQVQLPLGAWMR